MLPKFCDEFRAIGSFKKLHSRLPVLASGLVEFPNYTCNTLLSSAPFNLIED
jgi:hypothetical protein